jgi:hypothetical protein
MVSSPEGRGTRLPSPLTSSANVDVAESGRIGVSATAAERLAMMAPGGANLRCAKVEKKMKQKRESGT